MSSYNDCLSQINFDQEYNPIFFDVGCNINPIPTHCGTLDDFTEIVLNKFSNAKCYGLDPLFWQQYENKWKNDSRVVLIKKALSESLESKILYTAGSEQPIPAHAISSFYNRSSFGGKIKETNVECTTVDFLFDELGLQIIDYLKIDTEGAELLVLKGSESCLKSKKINYIQIEYGGTYDDANITVEDIQNYLNLFGYKEIFRTTEELLFSHLN